MAKERLNVTLDTDVKERLRQYAEENKTTISQVITDWALKLKVHDPQIRGQMHF